MMTTQMCNKCGECYNWADRYKHNCKVKTIIKDLKKKPKFFKFSEPNKTLRKLNKLIR